MPFGPYFARRPLRGVALRSLAAAVCLALAAPVEAGWFSHKTPTPPAPAASTGQTPPGSPISTLDATSTSASAPIPANPDELINAPGNSTLEITGEEGAEAGAPAAGKTTPEAPPDATTDANPDDDEVVLPSVEESDLDDSDIPLGQYSAEELAALGNLWERLRKGAQLDTSIDNERIEIQRNWYVKNSSYIERMSRRATRYLYYTISEAERRNLPTELALLPVIESAYDPFAYSHADAAGMWQFIPGTARIMGVKQNEWFDGRRDVIESTRAAYDFLSLLYKKFGDWQLVLAAYNAGPGAVQRAIDRNQADGLPTDFWSLRLPAETRSYVPRFLAIAQIVKTPETFGVDLHPVLNQPFFRAINIRSQVDMPQAASIAGVSLKEFYQLNPGFKRQATDPEGPYRLLVPAGLPPDFEADIAALPVPQSTVTQTYKVKKGDTLFRVARRFGMTPAALREINHLKSDRVPVGKELTIARGNASAEYLVLRQEMKLDRTLAPRRVLVSRIYKVRRGDTLASIARRHGVSVRALARLNHLGARARLRPGQVLTVKQVKATTRMAGTSSTGMRKITYKAKKGDTLSSIARRYKVSATQLANWNGKRSKLSPGQAIVIYVADAGGGGQAKAKGKSRRTRKH